MTKLFLHIGSHKTGTTSIQHACHKYLKDGADGTRYLNIRTSGQPIMKTNGQLDQFQCSIDMDAADKVFQPKDAPSKSGRYISSSEAFFWIHQSETLRPFAELIKDRFDEITIVCYLRRQDRLAVSHRKQVIEVAPASRFYGIDPTPLPQYRAHFDTYFDYAHKLENVWANLFGKQNIKVIPYDRDKLVDGDVVEDFAFQTGTRFNNKVSLGKNKSKDGNQTLVGLKLTQLKIPKKRHKKILSYIQGKGTYLPTQAEAKAFLEHYNISNKKLARDWSWNGQPISFGDSFDMYPASRTNNWNDDDILEILDAVFFDKSK